MPSPDAAETLTWVTVATTSDVAPGRVGVYTVEDHEIALCNVDGEFYAVDDVCTHDGGPLGQGELEGDEIECPRHGARFDVRTGKATRLPAWRPIAWHAVRIQGEDVQVATEHE